MPLPITPKPPYPNVPAAPGVPTLAGPVQVQNTAVLLVADAANVVRLFTGPRWGLFTQSGAPAFGSIASGNSSALIQVVTTLAQLTGIAGQSVTELEYRVDHRISTALQEQGAFLSYNKVSTPFQGRVTYAVSGLDFVRTAFLTAVANLQGGAGGLTLLNLVMPDYSYPSCNVIHHDFRRSAKSGISMLLVDIWVEEVRVTGTAAYSNTATPSAANTTNGGTVQTSVPTAAQQAAGPAGGLT